MTPQHAFSEPRDETHPAQFADNVWDEARYRHYLARRGLIPIKNDRNTAGSGAMNRVGGRANSQDRRHF